MFKRFWCKVWHGRFHACDVSQMIKLEAGGQLWWCWNWCKCCGRNWKVTSLIKDIEFDDRTFSTREFYSEGQYTEEHAKVDSAEVRKEIINDTLRIGRNASHVS